MACSSSVRFGASHMVVVVMEITPSTLFLLLSCFLLCTGGDGRAEGSSLSVGEGEDCSGTEAEHPGGTRTGVSGTHRTSEIRDRGTTGTTQKVTQFYRQQHQGQKCQSEPYTHKLHCILDIIMH